MSEWKIAIVLVVIAAILVGGLWYLAPDQISLFFGEKDRYPPLEAGSILAGEKQVKDGEPGWTEMNQVRIMSRGMADDAIVAFTPSGSRDLLVAYAVPKGTIAMSPLRNGSYDVYLFTGHDLNPATKRFERNASWYRLNRPVTFPVIRDNERYFLDDIVLQPGQGVPVEGAVPVTGAEMPDLPAQV